MDFAIAHGRRELSSFSDTETSDILMARQLKAQCLLSESRFRQAQLEADRILEQQPDNFTAKFIQAEGHYHQCHVGDLVLSS